MVPHGLVEIHADEPAVEQVVIDVLHQLALGSDGKQRLDQAGAQQALRGDRRRTRREYSAWKSSFMFGQDGIDRHPQFAQGMRIRDAFLQRAVTVQRVLGDVGLAHDGGGKVGLMQQRLPARDG